MFEWLEKLIIKRLIKKATKKIKILKLTAIENYEEHKDELLEFVKEKVKEKVREAIEDFLASKINR